MDVRTSDLSAKLLATENLNVVRARASTASFDIKSRVLTLPIWKDMTPEIEEMLVGHEIGHALYTGEKYIEPIQENPKMKSYLNVLEDVRIEKLVKRKYPGLRKRMAEGYRQLNERDFFGVKKIASMENMLLIDKINLYYKAGLDCGVRFIPEEKVFVNRAEHTETIEDVIQLAEEIYAYSKQKAEERKEELRNSETYRERTDEEQEDYGDESDDFDYEVNPDGEISADPQKKLNTGDNLDASVSDDELESLTERIFRDNLEDLADTDTVYNYWKLDTQYRDGTVIGYKRILEETVDDWVKHSSSYDPQRQATHEMIAKEVNSEFEKFKIESIRTVNYLVKEFEMKKSATLYKRAQTSKIGSLDMRKVWAYKLQDDLFKRVTTTPQGKNHGMVFLLDWSGSMSNVMKDTLKQVINLVMFCQRVQIPFRVLAFTSNYKDTDYVAMRVYDDRMKVENNVLSNAHINMNLFELFSSKMTTSEFNQMAKRVIDTRFQHNRGYGMGGTPLNEALGWVYFNLGEYIKQNSIEKLSLITLTDGEGSGLRGNRTTLSRRVMDYKSYKYVKQKHFIVEESSKKTYEITEVSGQQTETLLRMLKDKYDVALIGFYLSRNHARDLGGVVHAYYPTFEGDPAPLIEQWRKEFKDKGFAALANTGRDEMFLVPVSATKINDGELDIDSDARAASIAKDFGKYLNVKRTSRILLNRFATLVA